MSGSRDDVVAVQHTSNGWGTARFTLGEFEIYVRIIHTCRDWEEKPDLTWEIPLGDFSKDKREVTLYNYHFNITHKGNDVYTVGGKKHFE
ncbi:hypothetical protein L3Y34_010422 [Caenorhabditis briggsae]|uniref:Uncharacterized protein n=1 Tax=Caenorhabditis briggsae TaxID=6238 RepID=A0AAE8ZJY1_CAEBR|nr:hypothetical protein L3Y34_010422 [Caenorhabditis briggsae]